MISTNSLAKSYDTTAKPPGDLIEGEWKLMQNAEGTWAGRIQIQAKDVSSIQAIFAKLQGPAVAIDGGSHTIEVLSDFIKNPKGALG